MFYDQDTDKFILELDPDKPMRYAIGRELTQLVKELRPERKYRVDHQVRGPAQGTAVKELDGQLSYYGHSMMIVPGTTEIEIRTGGGT